MKNNYSTASRGTPDSLQFQRTIAVQKKYLSNKIRDGTATPEEQTEYKRLFYEHLDYTKRPIEGE